jgi:hypothetical protein
MLRWEHCTINCEIFGCGKVYYSNSIKVKKKKKKKEKKKGKAIPVTGLRGL